jgi:hypothetical protein
MNTDYFFKLDGPSTRGATSQMRIANLTGFQDLVRNFGADPRAILERTTSIRRRSGIGSLRRLQSPWST